MKRLVLVLAISMAALASAEAAQYCAILDDGQQQCGIPTLQSCEQTVSGVGGVCQIDDSVPLPENLLQRLEDREDGGTNPPLPGADDVPPPPDE